MKYAHNDVNLADIIKSLWNYKLIFILGLFLIIAISSLYTQNNTITHYKFKLSQRVNDDLSVIIDHDRNNDTIILTNIANLLSEENIVSIFLKEYNSTQNKTNFIQQESNDILVRSNMDSILQSNAYYSNKYINIETSEGNANHNNPAQKRYIDYSIDKSNTTFNTKLNDEIDILLSQLNIKLISKNARAKSNLDLEIKRLNTSYEIAKNAGIDKPINIDDHGTSFPINMGTRVIKAKINTLEKLSDMALLDPSISIIKTKLNSLRVIKSNIENIKNIAPPKTISKTLTSEKKSKHLITLVIVLLFSISYILLVTLKVILNSKVK